MQAQECGVALHAYLQEVLSDLANVDNAAEVERGKRVDVPLLHLGFASALRRADIYDHEVAVSRPRHEMLSSFA